MPSNSVVIMMLRALDGPQMISYTFPTGTICDLNVLSLSINTPFPATLGVKGHYIKLLSFSIGQTWPGTSRNG
jgi:hypothetical protein